MPDVTLQFASNLGLYAVVFAALPTIFFLTRKPTDDSDGETFSKAGADQLKGLAIVAVVIHHLAQAMTDSGALGVFVPIGYLAVGLFLFIAGFGVMKSSRRKPDYLDGFLTKKILQIYLPFVIANVAVVVAMLTFGWQFSVAELSAYTFGVRLIDHTSWFILTILAFYGIFWISAKLFSGPKILMAVAVLIVGYTAICFWLDLGRWTYVSSPCVLIGMAYAIWEAPINAFISKRRSLCRMGSAVLFTLSFVMYLTQDNLWLAALSAVTFSSLICLTTKGAQSHSWAYAKAGNVSLEIYLVHMKLLVLWALFGPADISMFAAVYLAAVLIAAEAFRRWNHILTAWPPVVTSRAGLPESQ